MRLHLYLCISILQCGSGHSGETQSVPAYGAGIAKWSRKLCRLKPSAPESSFWNTVEGEKNLSGLQEAQDLVSKVGSMATRRLRLLACALPSCLCAPSQPTRQWSQIQGLGPPLLVVARLMAKTVESEAMGEGVPSGAHFCSRAMSLMEKVA